MADNITNTTNQVNISPEVIVIYMYTHIDVSVHSSNYLVI